MDTVNGIVTARKQLPPHKVAENVIKGIEEAYRKSIHLVPTSKSVFKQDHYQLILELGLGEFNRLVSETGEYPQSTLA